MAKVLLAHGGNLGRAGGMSNRPRPVLIGLPMFHDIPDKDNYMVAPTLLQPAAFTIAGSCRFDPLSAVNFGGRALTIASDGTGYLTGNFATGLAETIGQISFPAVLGSGPVGGLPLVKEVQPFTPVLSRFGSTLPPSPAIGGLLEMENLLGLSVYGYYEAPPEKRPCFGEIPNNLASPSSWGLYGIAPGPYNLQPGQVAGYMSHLPQKYQQLLGWSVVAGQAGIPVFSRASSGPSLVGISFADFDSVLLAPAQEYLCYPQTHPLRSEQAPQYPGPADPVWGPLAHVGGGFIIDDTLVFVGWDAAPGSWVWYDVEPYPSNGDDGHGHIDPVEREHGFHSDQPRIAKCWLYNMPDVLSSDKPWLPQPYAVFQLALPYLHGSAQLSAALDPNRRRIWISCLGAEIVGSRYLPVLTAIDVA